MRENLKKNIVTKNVIGSEDTLMRQAESPSNCLLQPFHTDKADQERNN